MKKNYFLFLVIFCLSILPISSQAQEASFMAGDLMALEGVEGAAVYYVANDGQKYVFPDDKTYFTWYQDFADVNKVDIAELDHYPDGGAMPYRAGTRLVTHTNTAKIYAVEPGGVLRWISSGETAANLYGESWTSMVQDVIPGYFSSTYIKGQDLSNTLPTGTLIGQGNSYYYIDNGNKRKFIDTSTFEKNNFNYDFVLDIDNPDDFPNGLDILDEEEAIATYDVFIEIVFPDDEPVEEPTIIRDQDIIFLTRDTGEYLYNQGEVAEWFDDYNTTNSAEYSIVRRSYPDLPYVTDNNPYNYWALWFDSVCDNTDENVECLNSLADNHDVVFFTHSYNASDVLTELGAGVAGSTRKTVDNYKAVYNELKTSMDQNSETMFVVWTLPPRHPLYQPSSGTRLSNASRAADFSTWLTDEWLQEDGETHSNIKVFDFRSYTADDENYLKYDYRSAHTWPNAFLSQSANQELGPIMSQFLVDSMSEFFQ